MWLIGSIGTVLPDAILVLEGVWLDQSLDLFLGLLLLAVLGPLNLLALAGVRWWIRRQPDPAGPHR